MSTELTKNLMCIKLRSGIEIWVERERAENLINLLGTAKTKFIELGDEVINSADIEGVFSPKTMEDMARRKNGAYQCKFGSWHDKFEKCSCVENERLEQQRKKATELYA